MKKKVGKIVALALCVVLVSAMLLYLCQVQKADEDALDCCCSTDDYVYGEKSSYVEFVPTKAIKRGIVYYQGAQVDVKAFAFCASRLAAEGCYVALVKTPFNMAIFNVNAADSPIAENPDINVWFVAGFSLGGVAASKYAYSHQLDGLLLFASYPSDDVSDFKGRVLSVSATEDGLSTPTKIDETKALLPLSTVYVVIDGGNHTGFALYGGDDFIQKGDNASTIDKLQQQTLIVDAVLSFFAS